VTVVLVADDDADIRDLVAFKLEQAGLEVIAVEDGETALEEARAKQPELAVLDISMPGLSGIDVCRMLRADPATAGMLIIMLTARVQERDVEGGFSAGADDYVTKPFSPRELVSRIQALLEPHPRLSTRRAARRSSRRRAAAPRRRGRRRLSAILELWLPLCPFHMGLCQPQLQDRRGFRLLPVAGEELGQPVGGVVEHVDRRQEHDPQVVRRGQVEAGAVGQQHQLLLEQVDDQPLVVADLVNVGVQAGEQVERARPA
jgi:CheY-like chemotaxis protein